ncbi:MAG: hypothetical protein JXJ22_09640 [Bacteroidales bacterium]|nr:hypothetical protein [Bacteroidales bacterium]
MNNRYELWIHENHTIELDTNEMIDLHIEYIRLNPVKAGIVANAEDYLFSSCRNYAELESVMEIDEIYR